MVTTAARQDEVCVLFLCEQTKLMLKPETLYRFEVDENCPSCVKAAEPHRERLGSDSSPHYEIRAALSGGDGS